MKPSEILRRAQALIKEPQNWNTTYYKSSAIYSADGAIAEAAGLDVGLKWMQLGGPAYYEARQYAVEAQQETMPELITVPSAEVRDHVLAEWPGVTHEKVMEMFAKAIELAERDGR